MFSLHCFQRYCGWLNFCGVQIFVAFLEGPIHEFQCQRNSDSYYELWRKILWPRILNPTNVWFFFNTRKLVPTKIKPSTVWETKTNPTFSNATIIMLIAILNNVYISNMQWLGLWSNLASSIMSNNGISVLQNITAMQNSKSKQHDAFNKFYCK